MPQPKFIQRTTKKNKGWVPLTVVPLQPAHIAFWDTFIQPFIRAMGPTARVDWDWSWSLITSICKLTAPLRQQPAAYALTYSDPSFPHDVVCGIVQLARHFLYLPDVQSRGIRRAGGFLWKCSTAPPIALRPYFTDPEMPKRLAHLCIDVAVTSSYQDGYDGRICLHADPDAPQNHLNQDVLLEFYKNPPVNMFVLDSTIKIPRLRGILAPNDGRYFYFDEAQALVFSQQFAAYR